MLPRILYLLSWPAGSHTVSAAVAYGLDNSCPPESKPGSRDNFSSGMILLAWA